MIPDIETDVFDRVAVALHEQYDGISVYNEYARVPESFPSVSVVEADNSAYLPALDTEGSHHAQLMYEVNVYSNLRSGKKEQAKQIMQTIDGCMQTLGFARLGQSPMELPNADSSIYRMEARYRAIVNEKKQLLRR